MHKKFTLRANKLIAIAAFAFINFTQPISETFAQAKWSGVYGNEWLEGKYGQTWLRIGVKTRGMRRITLPAEFQNKPDQLHLYHRGVEVALTNATNNEIEFYGIPNDGASDALLYRPYTGTKANPDYSWYSDESSYFLTSAGGAVKRAEVQAQIPNSGNPEAYHLQKTLTAYTESDTYAGSQNLVFHGLDQSYLIEGKGRSSRAYYRRSGTSPGGNPIFAFPFQLKNLVSDPNRLPRIEVLLNGRTTANNKIKASIGKNSSTLTDFPGFIEFREFIPYKTQYSINPATDLSSGAGHFQLESVQITNVSETTGIYSVTNLWLIYPQTFDMSGLNSAVFNLLPGTGNTNVSIPNAPANAKVFDVTNPDAPRVISGVLNGTTLNVMVQRPSDAELKLLVTSEVKTDDPYNKVSFTNYDRNASDYLIISNETLFNSASSFADYRASRDGGTYRTQLFKIKDIYNQFNYGEPSPVAIKRFVDYMVARAPRSKHNLLLVGPSTTISEKLFVNRELPEEVPTIGFPGSDVLLVEGLSDGTADMPTIPVGRIPATSDEQVMNYLDKVKTYESLSGQNIRKKVLHVSGGLSEGEATKFAGYLTDYNPLVTNDPFKGSITQKAKGPVYTDYPNTSLNISSDINNGIGMLTYFGHGTSHYTDNNIGYVTDPSRNYNNNGKYPLLYFNGCGVGNIFNGGFSAFPTAPIANQMPVSSDWLLANKKGAVAIIANSYYAFEASSKTYIGALYANLFKSDSDRQTLGQLHKNTAKQVLTGNANDYDIASNHQTLLLGDPALRVLNVDGPLPVDLVSFEAKLIGTQQVALGWKTAWEKSNSHFLVERSYNARNFEVIGLVEGKGDSNAETLYQFYDNNPYPGESYYRLVQVDLAATKGSDEGATTYSRIVSVKIPYTDQLIIKPNPTVDKVNIKLQTSTEIKSWSVINVQGKYLQVNGKGDEVNLANYPAGEYIIELRTVNEDVYRRKVIKY